MANYSDEVTQWLTSVTGGDAYWNLAGEPDRAEQGSIKFVNAWGFVALVTGTWNSDTEVFEDLGPEEAFYPWTAIEKVGRA